MINMNNKMPMSFLDFIKENKILEQKEVFRKTENKNPRLIFNHEWINEKNEILENIKKQYSSLYFSKVRKYKILYFTYGAFLFLQEYFLEEKEKHKFFLYEEDNVWVAFQQGPILKSSYLYLTKDRPILLNFDQFNLKEKEFLKRTINILLNFPIQDLITASHNTTPWKKNFKNNYYDLIPIEEIKQYFKENPPFFIDIKKMNK